MSGGYDVIVIDCGSSSEHFTGAGAVAGNIDVAVTSEKAVDGPRYTNLSKRQASRQCSFLAQSWICLVALDGC